MNTLRGRPSGIAAVRSAARKAVLCNRLPHPCSSLASSLTRGFQKFNPTSSTPCAIREDIELNKNRGKRMARLIKFALCTLTVLLAASATQRPTSSFNLDSADTQLVNLSHLLGSVAATEATFVVFNPVQNKVIRHNPERAAQRFLPASTFQSPNSLIALETGVESGPEHVLAWPGRVPEDADFLPPSWSRDHSLRLAFGRSVLWY